MCASMMIDVPSRSNKSSCFDKGDKYKERRAHLHIHYGILSNCVEAIYCNCIKPLGKTRRANFHVVLALENVLGNPR